MFKSKFLWLNLIALVVLVITYLIDNDLFPQFTTWFGLALVVLNAIAGMLQTQTISKLKSKLSNPK